MNAAKLLQDLEREPRSPHRDSVMWKATHGVYHQFACDRPASTLIDDLREAGFLHLADHALDGRYDGNPHAGYAKAYALAKANAKPYR